jgi:hypothetical protein
MIIRTAYRMALAIAVTLVAGTAGARDTSCDRDCLDAFAKLYLRSVIANDPEILPLADNLRFTQDGIDYEPGKGFWETATGLNQHRLNVLDDKRETATGLAVMEEDGEPVLLAYRLKVEDLRITEIETLVVDVTVEGTLFNGDGLKEPRVEFMVKIPSEQRESREEIIRISQFYPDGLKAGSFVDVDAPFAEGARRQENGMVMAGPDCTLNENCRNMKTQPSPTRPSLRQRLLAVDEEQGIAFYWLAWEQKSGKTLIGWEAFKVYGNKIHAVEAFIEHGDSTIDSGWK